jgi:hypothetical protein
MDKPAESVILDKLTVTPVAGGFRLCLQGFVPLQEVPLPDPQALPDKRLACLETVRVAFPELIPEPWRDRIRL